MTLCYGGGPVSLKSLAASSSSALIICKGSGRAAQFLEDWVNAQRQINALHAHRTKKHHEEAVRLELKQRQHAETSLRADAANVQKPPSTIEKGEMMRPKPAWWDVSSFVEALEKLGRHKRLYFFDINQKMDIRTSKQERLNPMLPPLLDSIVKSERVKDEVKLPLAIRLNRETGENAAVPSVQYNKARSKALQLTLCALYLFCIE